MMPHIVDRASSRSARERETSGVHVVAGTVISVGYSDSKLHLKRFILHLEMYCICYLESPNPSSARARRKRSTRGITSSYF